MPATEATSAQVKTQRVAARAFAAFCAALIVLSGCTTTAPQSGYPVSGRVGVVVMSSPFTVQVPSVGGSFTESFLTGLIGPAVMVPPLFFLGLGLAPFMAIQAGDCTNKLHTAYPNLSDKLLEVFPREFLPSDLRDQIVNAYKEQTSAQIAAFDIAAGAGIKPSAERLIAEIEQGGMDYLLFIEFKRIELEPTTRTICASWAVRLVLEAQLWSVSERRVVSESLIDLYQNKLSLQPIPLTAFKPLLDEPGALRAYLLRVFEATARFMVNRLPFEFTP